jgi:hypothetical protein
MLWRETENVNDARRVVVACFGILAPFVPSVLIRLDREWGRGDFYQVPLVIGCYILAFVFIQLWGAVSDQGRRVTSYSLIGFAIFFDIIGTFILGCPWISR